ncbi:germination protein YpeB [Bacillus solimangrovi]|uniref:Germination protein YpeB n=1 Tax=Bacillus solimangrovi TaxID=1305675 RepID=A0A1E5LHC3_9BACI|nr:germination protein YpeB [Bacillus solimangrovi]OEH93478.1 germination protein YpeB [Bacillus solimangrovi]
MIRNVIIGVLVVMLIGTGYWGYQENQEKNAILIHAENGYQRAFHDLTYQMDLLHNKIGSALAMNSRSQLSPALADVWRLTSEAHSDVGQLPLSLLPFNKTEEFLTDIGDFSYRTAVRDLEKKPLSEEEYKTLQQLFTKSTELKDELRKVQALSLNNNLRWMDVELALVSGKEQDDNTIIDGFKTVEKNVESYGEADFGPTFTQMTKKKEDEFRYLTGKELNKEELEEKARQFLGLEKNAKVIITESGKGANYEFYSLQVEDSKGHIYMDMTKKGGVPIWVMNEREVSRKKISLNEAAEKAQTYLTKHGFKNLELVESTQFDNTGVFIFVSSVDNVRIYPDAIRVKTALDNGQITGLSAKDYLMSHHDRKLPKPTINAEQAKQKLNPQLKIQQENLALIVNELGEEVLCHEFFGTIGESTYRIFINSITGDEEKVEKLQNAEPIYDALT